MSHPELTPTKPARHSTGVSANCGLLMQMAGAKARPRGHAAYARRATSYHQPCRT